ncbi:MAG: radical SAM family heme chaperone HemW [Opitutaceae bacterium]|nr:radical SAM family heme chaperone HemW [Cytophagales bacterium]
MFGIYIHIPFCRQACHYCDFHFSTNLSNKTEMVKAIVHELNQKKDFYFGKTVETIYLGGGTPSLLSEIELASILETIYKEYKVNPEAEITIECNPEDISFKKLSYFKKSGVNRLSIGIQTFNDKVLHFLNRSHSSQQADLAVKLSQDLGFDNITVDIMYALPGSNLDILQTDLDKIILLGIPHISAYCFTLEEKTVFGKMVKQNKLLKNEDSIEQSHYENLHKHLSSNGYEQYEISNFARNEKYSRHNSAYWFGRPYLGIGPGAHTFNGSERQWNISNNALYIQKTMVNENAFEIETLSKSDIYNEGLLTQLRTKWGVNAKSLLQQSEIDLFSEKQKEIEKLIINNMVYKTDSHLFLTEKGKLLADGIVVDLMI